MSPSPTPDTHSSMQRFWSRLLRRRPPRATWKATLADVRRAEFHHLPGA